ncbi:class I SAM-dependent methyltransferase [Streptomyces sp. DSM 44915]|uniref:Class I SAM-dependent methyltransferase n=1 Tax=Streptomyces chisholmiae TaxID=3075540 RepID=A0ABU2JNK4_9ACTN|nr:class I SAM-dependent methyltransferase [Streptomyces sp. DSM 44915]MDT0266576.1 class I SAM-dependent methyltransferase [Streptomyces sp. DSM 44915]
MRPYEALSRVYDRWVAENDYPRWADFVHRRLSAQAEPARSVLDVCCGTGRMTALLQKAGYRVTGVDGSAPMLRRATGNVAPGTRLVHAELPADPAALGGPYDAAVCCFDSVNYFTGPEEPRGLLGTVAAAVRPGGLFVFDVNTRHKLETVHGDSNYGDRHEDFAYVWRNRYDPATRRVRFLITLFVREPGEPGGPDGPGAAGAAGAAEPDGPLFRRAEETHEQRWWEPAELRAAAEATGWSVESVGDDYSDTPPGPGTLRESWVLRRRPAQDDG